ncbi:carbohydrate ABC transporter permease [Paenibacillus sinopodophylli]|uniref:carbohydrate ABC transporter permease n=1 Tax=Paenibacillus sinopodophylli TaxID=1837342 RepID=UPI00110D11E5|nr:carbohydrate ABC transporter permease [Paenibacillus sinopodophylli]
MNTLSNKKVGTFILSIAVWGFAIVMIYPLLWLFSSSFKHTTDVYVLAHQLIPTHFYWENYVNGFKGFAGHSFLLFFRNSLYVTVLSVIGTVIASTMAAYAFARIRFPGSSFWFACMMLTLMLPGEVLIIPQYMLFNKLDWINTFWPLIVPSFAGGAFFIFLLVQFMRGIPIELDESARIDGCGRFHFFAKIMLPLIVPAIVTTAVFKFIWTWDDYFAPLLYLNSAEKATVSLAIKSMADPTMETDWGALFAMSVLSLVPVIAVFIGFQKYIVDGISTTGLKG